MLLPGTTDYPRSDVHGFVFAYGMVIFRFDYM